MNWSAAWNTDVHKREYDNQTQFIWELTESNQLWIASTIVPASFAAAFITRAHHNQQGAKAELNNSANIYCDSLDVLAESYTMSQFKRIPYQRPTTQVPQNTNTISTNSTVNPKPTDNLDAYLCIWTQILNSQHRTTGIAGQQWEQGSSLILAPNLLDSTDLFLTHGRHHGQDEVLSFFMSTLDLQSSSKVSKRLGTKAVEAKGLS